MMHLHQPEVSDRHTSLQDPDITVRSYLYPRLFIFWSFEDIPALISIAKTDSSLAIQHNAAIAISDILSRYRLEDTLKTRKIQRIAQKSKVSIQMMYTCCIRSIRFIRIQPDGRYFYHRNTKFQCRNQLGATWPHTFCNILWPLTIQS